MSETLENYTEIEIGPSGEEAVQTEKEKKKDGRSAPRTERQIAALKKAQEARRPKLQPRVGQLALLKQQAEEDAELERKLFEIEQLERSQRNEKLNKYLNKRIEKLSVTCSIPKKSKSKKVEFKI
jgi:hypothetical protein